VIIHVLGEPAAAMATATASTACMFATAKAKEVDDVTVIMFTPKKGVTLYYIILIMQPQVNSRFHDLPCNSGEK
jgi:hypothetical protein